MFDTDSILLATSKVATGEVSAEGSFAALDLAFRQFPGHKLFTVLHIDWDRGENRRLYSSAPDVYPCAGAKPLQPESQFFREVVVAGRSRLCQTVDDCRAAFFDHALIEQLGCGSAVNVPVRSGGQTIGSLNLLHEPRWYTPDMIPTLERLALKAAALFPTPLHLPAKTQ